MKYVIALVFSLLLVSSVYAAPGSPVVATASVSPTPQMSSAAQPAVGSQQGYFYASFGAGIDLPGSGWDPSYYLGLDSNIRFGYETADLWFFQLDTDNTSFAGNSTNLYNFRGLLDVGKAFGPGPVQPYVLLGAGLVFQTLSPAAASTSNFDGEVGAGLRFVLGSKTALFVEGRYNLIASQTTTFGDIPVVAGIRAGF